MLRRKNKMKTKKIVVQVEERITYDEDIIITVPEDMPDELLEAYVETAVSDADASMGGAKDISFILEDQYNLDVEHASSFPESPRSSELEIINFYTPKEKDEA
jgi:hypothetical protein